MMDFLRRFMAGRYGSDQLNNAFLLLACVLMVIEWVLGWRWMSVFILALLLLCYFRMFSHNIQARYSENQKFLRYWGPLSRRLHNAVLRFRDRKTHRYFKCPNCHKRLHDHLSALPHAVCPEKLKKRKKLSKSDRNAFSDAITGTDAP